MTIKTDVRQIESIWWEDAEVKVGDNGVTKIVPYYEPGEMGNIVWFEIWSDDIIWHRVNARCLHGVTYPKED
jgi:hypothetical protein